VFGMHAGSSVSCVPVRASFLSRAKTADGSPESGLLSESDSGRAHPERAASAQRLLAGLLD
jgi:hypothetical protein